MKVVAIEAVKLSIWAGQEFNSGGCSKMDFSSKGIFKVFSYEWTVGRKRKMPNLIEKC